jgi:hypothetical protein
MLAQHQESPIRNSHQPTLSTKHLELEKDEYCIINHKQHEQKRLSETDDAGRQVGTKVQHSC